MMIPEESKKIFIDKFSSFGDEKFYQFLLNYAIGKIADGNFKKKYNKSENSPEKELLSYYDKFLFLYRNENNIIYLDIAKLFRRAANKIYRILLKKKVIKKSNIFFNLVEKI